MSVLWLFYWIVKIISDSFDLFCFWCDIMTLFVGTFDDFLRWKFFRTRYLTLAWIRSVWGTIRKSLRNLRVFTEDSEILKNLGIKSVLSESLLPKFSPENSKFSLKFFPKFFPTPFHSFNFFSTQKTIDCTQKISVDQFNSCFVVSDIQCFMSTECFSLWK